MATWHMQLPTNKISKLSGLSAGGMSRLSLLMMLIVWFGALGVVAANRQNIFDWWQLRNYQAPDNIVQLANEDSLTPAARKIFYVNHAAVDDKSSFSKLCPNNGGEQTIVLGCYHSNQAGIFLLSVGDTRLNGVEQVTAAHEMLHGAYDRLSSANKSHVNAMLLDYYSHGLSDPRILKTIEAYKKSEPNDLINEMHSVFGSEIAKLPPGLEQYYQRYFSNRAQVAAYATAYQEAFTSRQAVLSRDEELLSHLKLLIDAAEADLKTRQANISARQSALISQRNGGNIEAYNAAVPAYNGLIDQYNNEVQAVQRMIDEYNQLVASRNAVAFEEDQLINDLNPSSAPISH